MLDKPSVPVFARVGPPFWNGRPVAIVGNGPSIGDFDLTSLCGRFHVLAVKGAIFDLAWADAGFGLDIPRYGEWRGMFNRVDMPVFWATPKLKYMGDGPHAPCVSFIRRVDLSELSDDPGAICSGGTSGFGALNLVWLKRARRIVLLGYDYNADAVGFHSTRAYISHRAQDHNRWVEWSRNFDKIKGRLAEAGVRVINASPQSRITAFPRMPIKEALEAIDAG